MLSTEISKQEAIAIEGVCTDLAVVLAKIDVILEHASDLNIVWTDDPLPAYIDEDADGNINGVRFSRTDVSNAIGSLMQFRNCATNQAVSQGDHLGNINKLARPMPLR